MFRKTILPLMLMTTLLTPLAASAETSPNPVISRNCPAYAGNNPATASAGNDDFYYSFWSGSAPDYLAYDLSGVPEEERKVIDAVWYNPSAYDVIGMYVNRNMEPSDYTIEVNAAPGGTYPEDGWEVVAEVAGNTLSSRQHVIEFEGYNWIRIHVTGVDEKEGGTCQFNFDIHNVSDGVTDSWMFFGDSITAGGMNNCFGTGFATYVNQLDERYFPIQENGGIGGITSTDGRDHIDRWLSTCEANYVSLAYGTNDAWGNQSGTEKYYENTVYMIEAILEAGKTPVLPKIPYSTNADVGTYVGEYNAMIDRIYEEYPEVIPGPDFETYFKENPDGLSGDGVHPNDVGYDAMRQLWAQTMYERVYTAEGGEVTSPESGDVNGDGTFDLTDVVTMQKYILGVQTLRQPDNGDLMKDGVLNVYDLALMKKTYFMMHS